jgi:peptidoglycan-associated lipoprotein
MRPSIRATTIFALVLTTVLVGCARRPAVMSMVTPAPVGSPVARPPGAGPDSTVVVIEERRDEIIVADRPEPAAFSDNRNVKAIYFDFDRYDIRPNDAQMLEVDAAWLKTNDMLILVEGQCDERGTSEYNIALGDRRAQATKNYLIALGIPASRISTVSYGKERPVCAAHTEDCWAANRRAHLIVKPRG